MTRTAVELESWSKKKKKHNSLLFPRLPLISWPSVTQRDHIKALALCSCTGTIRPLPLPSPETTSPPPFFSPRLSSTSEDHRGLLSIIQRAWRRPATLTETRLSLPVAGAGARVRNMDAILTLSPLLCNLIKLFACNKSTVSSPPQLV